MGTEVSPYVEINIKALMLDGGGEHYDVFIELPNQKMIKIGNQGEEKMEALRRYHGKGIISVYLLREQHQAFISSIKDMLTNHAKEGQKAEEEKRMQKLNAGHSVFKSLFNEGLIDDESKQMAQDITKGSMELISTKNIFDQFEKFKKNCSAEYMHAIITSYVACCMMDTFSWSNEAMKEKVVMASLLCDIILTPRDFKELEEKKNDPKTLSKRVYEHPKTVAAMIGKKKNFVSAETLTIIEQHHERPNGKGFPDKLGNSQVAVLTALYIVANYFVERMFEVEFTEEQKEERVQNIITQITDKFYGGNYGKASKALAVVMGCSA